MTQTLERITHPAKNSATHSILWLHGLGADGHDFAPIIPHLNLQPHTRVLLPHAPIRPITINNGYPMRAWYDITQLNINARSSDPQSIQTSHQQLLKLIEEEQENGIPAKNILLAGFSQGGAMALHTGLRTPCAGILALSCYLLMPETLTPAANPNLPILQMHGTQDPIVSYSLGQQAHNTLIQLNYQPQWQSYPMAHEVNGEQIQAIAQWLNQLGF